MNFVSTNKRCRSFCLHWKFWRIFGLSRLIMKDIDSSKPRSCYEMFKLKLRTLNYPKICLYFASMNMVIKCIVIVIAYLLDEFTLWMIFAPNGENDIDFDSAQPTNVIRPVLYVDCSISLIFSVLLIWGVQKQSVCIMNICFIYGSIALALSVGSAASQFVLMFMTGDFSQYQRRILHLIITAIVVFEVYSVYKTYKQFKKNGPVEPLALKKTSEEGTERSDMMV